MTMRLRAVPALVAALALAPALLPGAVLAAPRAPAGGARAAADRARARLERADDALRKAVRAAGAPGLGRALADDPVLLEPGLELVRGRDAIRAALAAADRTAAWRGMRLHRVGAGVSADGVLGYTFGWLQAARAGGKPAYGKYLAVWRRAAGGWQVEAFARSEGRARPARAPRRDPVAAGRHGVANPGDPAALAAEVVAADTAFGKRAERDGPCAAFPEFADANAILFGGADFFWGLEGVRRAWSDCAPGDGLRFAPVHASAASSGDLGWSAGNATFSSDDGKAVTLRHTKYLTVWARQRDRSWRWLLDAGNPRPGP
jgi:ketosteroid isomerase-like protein